MNPGTALAAVGRQLAGGSISETFDDGGLAGSVQSDNESKWIKEFDNLCLLIVEGANAQNLELVDARHPRH